jgi:hypothetical protein
VLGVVGIGVCAGGCGGGRVKRDMYISRTNGYSNGLVGFVEYPIRFAKFGFGKIHGKTNLTTFIVSKL